MKMETRTFSYPEEGIYYIPVGSTKELTPYDFFNSTDSDVLVTVSAKVSDKPYIVFNNLTLVVPANELVKITLVAFGLCSPSTSTACWAIDSNNIEITHNLFYFSDPREHEEVTPVETVPQEKTIEPPRQKRFRRSSEEVRLEKEKKALEILKRQQEAQKLSSAEKENFQHADLNINEIVPTSNLDDDPFIIKPDVSDFSSKSE